ncbi:hypothetical protein DPMN_015520 [Dreissena polymorpha]|uniref:Uncharacterized protein n=1 Tax=Dreissena polymorpha TaxID=45954 RepID=A0A9D4S5J3_DREPO|nr:hypothetical protein DPMN_015520 [Dreissena polymorpha]
MNNKWPHGGNVFQQTGTIFELVQDIIGTNLLTKFHEDPIINVASTVLTRQIFMTHNGRQTIDKSDHKKKTAPHPGGHVFLPIWTIFELNRHIQKTHTKNVTSRVFTCFHYKHKEKTAPPPGGHVFSPIWTIFKLVQDINETNVLTNFHDDWTKIVTSRVFTRNTAPPPGGHLHEDWASNVTSTVFTSFELSRGINGTNVLTKFHEDRTINVASGMFTRQMLTLHNARWTKGDHVVLRVITRFFYSQINKTAPPPVSITGRTNILTKFHEDWTLNVTPNLLIVAHFQGPVSLVHNHHMAIQEVITRFFYSQINKTAPPPVSITGRTNILTKFHEDWTLNVTPNLPINENGPSLWQQSIITTDVLTKKTAPPPCIHVFSQTSTIFEVRRVIIRTNVLTNLNEDRIIFKLVQDIHTNNVASRLLKGKILTMDNAQCTTDKK